MNMEPFVLLVLFSLCIVCFASKIGYFKISNENVVPPSVEMAMLKVEKDK